MTRDRSATDFIVIHSSATPPTQDIGAADLDRRHRAQGWLGIGFHWVIRRDGKVEPGRREASVGAHDPALNATSIGVCMVGGVAKDGTPEDNFTEEQHAAMYVLVAEIDGRYPGVATKLGKNYPTPAK